MTTLAPNLLAPTDSPRAMNALLWSGQGLLAAIYGIAGGLKIFVPLPELTQIVSYTAGIQPGLVRFIGVAEVAGALGLILPALTRIKPSLTPLAALGLSVIQILAMVYLLQGVDGATMLPTNLSLLGLSLFVLWGRWKRAPIAPLPAEKKPYISHVLDIS